MKFQISISSILAVCLTACLLLSSCDSTPIDPNAERIEKVLKKLEGIRTSNMVFGVHPVTGQKVLITKLLLEQRMKTLGKVSDDTRVAYLLTKDKLNSQSKSAASAGIAKDSSFNEYLFATAEDHLKALGDEKVYEGAELENAHWFVSTCIEQMEHLKGEIEQLGTGK